MTTPGTDAPASTHLDDAARWVRFAASYGVDLDPADVPECLDVLERLLAQTMTGAIPEGPTATDWAACFRRTRPAPVHAA